MTTVIDFENFSDLQEINTVSVPGNEVTFTTGTTTGTNPAYIAGVGDPVTGFYPNDGAGTPIESQIGDFFLTNQNTANDSNWNDNNYFIEFDQPVENLSIDTLDFFSTGERMTLTVFSDSFSTAVGSDTFTIPSGVPEQPANFPHPMILVTRLMVQIYLRTSLLLTHTAGMARMIIGQLALVVSAL